MARIVAVHGIGQQLEGAEVLRSSWLPALRDGLHLAGVPETDLPRPEDFSMAFYGDLFRGSGTKGAGELPYAAADVEDDWEKDMLAAWWETAAALDSRVPGPAAQTKGRTPSSVQRALNVLGQSRFFTGLAERAMIGDLKQVRRYFGETAIRRQARLRVERVVGAETRMIIGHSLGSVVAYEALCAHPEWPVRALVTLGSPLGIRRLVFERLEPAPVDGKGAWPGGIKRWTNVADRGDVVALVKKLRPHFGEIDDVEVDNEARAHDARPYFTARQTGAAIAESLGI